MSTGDFIKKPDRRFKLLILIQGLWAITLITLALWWGTLLRQQSDEIANLQTQLGAPEHQVQGRLDRTERMISGESGAFVFIILITNGILLFFFARDTKRSRSLEAFFASITHELRTPLTSIRLQAETLKEIQSDPKQAPFLARLLEDVTRLEAQVQETLELARIEGGGEINLQSIPLKSFLEKRILPHYILDESRINLTLTVEDATVQADPASLTIIIRNLLDNALKYSSVRPTKLSIRGAKDANLYALTVLHENSAFQADRDQLGKLFYRGKNSQGAGIGLYLVNTLMNKMNGHAKFLPEENNFSVRLNFLLEKGGSSDA
jgi:signal transduction histidine kinase